MSELHALPHDVDQARALLEIVAAIEAKFGVSPTLAHLGMSRSHLSWVFLLRANLAPKFGPVAPGRVPVLPAHQPLVKISVTPGRVMGVPPPPSMSSVCRFVFTGREVILIVDARTSDVAALSRLLNDGEPNPAAVRLRPHPSRSAPMAKEKQYRQEWIQFGELLDGIAEHLRTVGPRAPIQRAARTPP